MEPNLTELGLGGVVGIGGSCDGLYGLVRGGVRGGVFVIGEEKEWCSIFLDGMCFECLPSRDQESDTIPSLCNT